MNDQPNAAPISRNVLIFIGAGALVILFAWWGLPQRSAQEEVEAPAPGVVEQQEATTTEEASPSAVAAPQPPPEVSFPLPAGAVSVDEYAYVHGGAVFFKSITGKAALKVGDADASTFKRLSDFVSLSNDALLRDCGGSALYAYYGDESRVYFYQVWRTSTFRATKVERVSGVTAKDFTVVGGVGRYNNSTFALTHTVIENGTCRLEIEQKDA